ncbi:MAG: sugar ABC transporter permease [Bifidobacteriaceae bacterium]|jgi:putative multiple sugar transport system permease protein|nr:sugar ABC transporter permease [Bifidobacteriaceae bacterium]
MKYLKQILGGDLRQFTMVFALVVILVAFNIMSSGRMLTSQNIMNLLVANTYVLVLALGMLMVIVVGHIDLSVGSVAGFVGMIVAMSSSELGFPWWAAILAGIGVGALIGAWQGFWLAKVGIPGFITTLAGWMIFRGAVIWISHSISRPVPHELRVLGSGYLPDWGRELTGLNLFTVVIGVAGILVFIYLQLRKRARQAKVTGKAAPLGPTVIRLVVVSAVIAYVSWILASGNDGTSIPIPTIIVGALVIFYAILTQRTTFGRHIYAVGGNRQAAALSGVSVPKTYFFTMFNMSILAAVAGILFVGRATAAGPNDGNMWELDAIASVFIGGAAVTGGIGTVGATMVGALVMAAINSGLMLMGVGQDKTQVIKGLVLLAAVAVDVYNKKQGRASITGTLFKKKGEVEAGDAAPSPAKK